jgi:hypothetical protein
MSLIIPRNFKRANAQGTAAQDAKFKIGDRVRDTEAMRDGVIVEVNAEKPGYYAVKYDTRPQPQWNIPESHLTAADSRAGDASGTDAKLQKGDKVRVWQYPVYGKLGEVVEAAYGGMEYTVNVEGKDYPRIDYRRIVKVSNAAGDAAEFHVGQRVRAKDPAYEYSDGKALGAGMFTVKEVRNNGDVKLDDGGDVWISPNALVEANDACGKGVDE